MNPFKSLLDRASFVLGWLIILAVIAAFFVIGHFVLSILGAILKDVLPTGLLELADMATTPVIVMVFLIGTAIFLINASTTTESKKNNLEKKMEAFETRIENKVSKLEDRIDSLESKIKDTQEDQRPVLWDGEW